MILKIVD